MAKLAPSATPNTPESHTAAESAAAKAQRARQTKSKSQAAAFTPTPTVLDASPPAVSAPATNSPAAGVELIHIKACFPSPLNPRKTFPEEGVAEMAESIAASGLIQPLTGRAYTEVLENVPNAREIYVGGRRLRALDLLFETGRWPHDHLPGYLVPVLRRDVGDMELLRIALAENLNREDMHPLEEGEALAEFRRRGVGLEEVAATYGKTPRWVQMRIQVAETLDPETRKLFAKGAINFEAARELVRLPAEVRSGHIAAIRMQDKAYRTAADIRDRINEGLPRVKDALFNPSLYTGERMNGPEVKHLERFADVAQFRQLQEAAIEERIKALEAKWSFVEVFREKKKPPYFSEWSFLQDHKLDRMHSRADKKKHGAVVVVFPDLTIEVVEGVCQGKAPPAPPTPTKASLKASGDAIAAISNSRRTYAHQRKSAALQLAILRKGRRAATEMMVMALLGDGCTIAVRSEQRGPDNRNMAPELVAQLRRWQSEVFDARTFAAYKPGENGANDAYLEFAPLYGNEDQRERRLAVYEQIGGLTDEQLDELFTLLVTARCGSFVEYQGAGVLLGNLDLTVAMATRYEANMACDWQIDDAYLATMSRDQLHALTGKINLWCSLRNLPTLELAELQQMKVAEMRQTMAEHVRANGVRLVPPEMRFESSKMVEANLRTFGEGGKVGKEPVQTDIQDMIDKAADVAETPDLPSVVPTAATIHCSVAQLDRTLLAEATAALPLHPDFGQGEIWLSAPGSSAPRLLLDASSTVAGSYYVIGLEGAFGPRQDAATIEEVLRGWLASVAPALTDAAIDALFDNAQTEDAA